MPGHGIGIFRPGCISCGKSIIDLKLGIPCFGILLIFFDSQSLVYFGLGFRQLVRLQEVFSLVDALCE